MGKGTEEMIARVFPNLAADEHFKITSKQTSDYNCIAWAYCKNDCWMWPNTGKFPFLDGVHYWPDESLKDENVDNFIEAFSLKGYEICNDESFDIHFRKIALYVEPGTKKCTHAARQLRNGFWTSKLGDWHDIQHGSPDSVSGVEYGVVYCIMAMPFE